MEDRDSETARLLTATLASLVIAVSGLAVWDEQRAMAILLIVCGGAFAVLGALALFFPGMRYEERRRRRFAELERTGAIANVPPERVRAWSALSDLYLDTDVGDLVPSIAERLAESPYTEQELWEMLADEVGPVCYVNFLVAVFAVAGEWAGFGEKWLTREILATDRRYQRFPVLRGIGRFVSTFIVFRDWRAVLRRVRELRAPPAA